MCVRVCAHTCGRKVADDQSYKNEINDSIEKSGTKISCILIMFFLNTLLQVPCGSYSRQTGKGENMACQLYLRLVDFVT